jgi:3-oxoacyl-[acyl-carrier protein] reductase
MRVEDKVTLIVGGGRGIGRAIAHAFVSEGAKVAVLARTQTQVEEVAQSIQAAGGVALALVGDVASPADIDSAISTIEQRLGCVQVLVNSAARLRPIGPFADVDIDDWWDTFQVNLRGPAIVCRRVIPAMIKAGSGKIINMSGGGATSPRANFTAYGVSKAALVRFTETLAEELKPHNIQVNAIAPGAVRTQMTEEIVIAGQLAGSRELQQAQGILREGGNSAENAAELAVFLASAESDGITGRLISAVWDDWRHLGEHSEEIAASDLYTLRRVVPKDRS